MRLLRKALALSILESILHCPRGFCCGMLKWGHFLGCLEHPLPLHHHHHHHDQQHLTHISYIYMITKLHSPINHQASSSSAATSKRSKVKRLSSKEKHWEWYTQRQYLNFWGYTCVSNCIYTHTHLSHTNLQRNQKKSKQLNSSTWIDCLWLFCQRDVKFTAPLTVCSYAAMQLL